MELIQKRETWNNGKLIGQKPPLMPKDIWAIQIHLQNANAVRDLGMFKLAIDSKLPSGRNRPRKDGWSLAATTSLNASKGLEHRAGPRKLDRAMSGRTAPIAGTFSRSSIDETTQKEPLGGV